MRNQTNWTKGILMWGLVLVGLGVVVAVVGIILPGLVNGSVLSVGLVPGISIILFVIGIVSLAQYAFIRANPTAGQQMMIQERDERLQLIRARAGHRAYWISSSLAFFVLIWTAFAGDVGLPTLSGNTLWFSMVAVVVVPFIVYVGNIAYEQNNS
jgi:hypothetical protein